jgi:UDP-N-acetylmuramoylalanine--D-glutamate ligase
MNEDLQPPQELPDGVADSSTPVAGPVASPTQHPPVDALSAGMATDAVEAPIAELGDESPVPPQAFESKALTAAKDAAAFVASIFEADAQNQSSDDSVDAQAQAVEEDHAVPAWVAAPVGWPQGVDEGPLNARHVLILGLGVSGLAMARWCVRCGAQVTVADTREAPPQLTVLRAELPQVKFVSGPLGASLLEQGAVDAVFRSPGLSPASVAAIVHAAQATGIAVGGELDLYAAAMKALQAGHGYAPAVLAITGTNGKTTVTSLTGQLVAHAGKTVALAGNIGPTLLDTLCAHLDAQSLPEVWVLELSSFQLDGVKGFEPTAATVLNVTQDHIDWHGGMPAYAAAKARIFGEQALMVLNREDALVMDMLPPPVRVKLQKPQLRVHVTFGGDMPQRPGDFGIEVISGMAWLVRAQLADETIKRSRLYEEELHIQRLMPADALRIRGRHNAINALAALALATAAGCPLASMLYGLREYRGEPHRVEPIGLVDGVEYFDDSKGTNVGATVAALTGLGAERRIVVILGGDGKGQDFSPLASPVARYVRAAVLIGRDAPLVHEALAGTGVLLVNAATLPEAVALAAQHAQQGDAVLMSPACASLDMFRDYAHRAQVFCDTVREIAQQRGQDLEGGL